MLEKIKAACFNSATMAVQYAGLAFGLVMSNMDTIAMVIGDPGFVAQVQTWFGGNPKVIGAIMSGFSVITMAARMRGLMKRAD